MQSIPPNPIPSIAAGLVMIFLAVLILPFKVRKVEENLEIFFLIMGILAITISGMWSKEIIINAIKDPVSIGGTPIGIFQVVLIAGLFIHFYNEKIYRGIVNIMNKLGLKIFVFLMIITLGLLSSLMSVIVAAVLLSEIVAAMPVSWESKVKITVVTCFAVGLGAALTPVGEPLATIAISKLSGPPYHADFFFLFRLLADLIVPGIIAMAILGAYWVSKEGDVKAEIPEYGETLRTVVMRAVKVYAFVSALVLLGHGLTPLVIWYFTKIPPSVLFWVNMISAILDNATLTAAEIAPELTLLQIKSALIGLLVSGGMLIPGNIPNIVSAGRLRIKSGEWARIGVPLGLVMMFVYFIAVNFPY